MKALSLIQRASRNFQEDRIPKKKCTDVKNNEIIFQGGKKFKQKHFIVLSPSYPVFLMDHTFVYKSLFSLFNFLVESISSSVDEYSLKNCLTFKNEDLELKIQDQLEETFKLR